jgi:hypothetical protein
MGFGVAILGDARSYWGQDRYPILIRPEACIEHLHLG